MSDDPPCPQCASGNSLLSRKRQVRICEDCGHEWSLETRSVQPLRLFLSYGHDGNEELVHRIKVDLEKRGHDVWFDKDEIKAGDDWRERIADGITRSDKFVSFLSKHSTRDPGVCRDEIAIAIGVKGGNIQTILVESEEEVQPPVNIGHIQWLDMHDWKERRTADENTWEEWYQAKLAEIVRVVESDESRRFAGEIETLNGHLKPIKSEARISQLLGKGFYGRQWLFEAVEQWRTGGDYIHEPRTKNEEPRTSPSRLFWIMGAPGVGKSAFAAQLTHTRGDTVIAAQFCEWDKPDHRNAPRVVRSLAFQLATRLPDYRKLLLTLPEIAELDRKDAAELFDYLLANPLRLVIHGGRERYLIVIDALDEAGEAGRNPLVEMLARNAQRLPDWLGLVVTSRPEFDVKTPLQALNPFPLDTQSESNRADIRDYLRHELATQLGNRPDADHLVEQILEKSEGVFLYVERFCDDVQRGHFSLNRPEQFPQGLGGIFCQYFQRQFPDLEKFRKDVRPALRAILAAREPLPVEILQRLFHWQDEELRDFTRPIASLFPVTTEAGHEVIKPYHKSLVDWLANEATSGAYLVSLTEGHRMLADVGWRDYQRGFSNLPAYFRSHLVGHLLACQRWMDATTALTDVSCFMELWNAQQFNVRAYWSQLQRDSSIRFVDAYQFILDAPKEYVAAVRCVAWLMEDYSYLSQAAALHRFLIDYHRENGNLAEEQWSLGNLGVLAEKQGHPDEAMALYREQETICRESKLPQNSAVMRVGLWKALNNQGLIEQHRNSLDAAMCFFKEVEEICTNANDGRGLMHSYRNQADILREQGFIGSALAAYGRAEQLCREFGRKEWLPFVLLPIAEIYEERGRLTDARGLYEEHNSICRDLNDSPRLVLGMNSLARVMQFCGAVASATDLRNEAATLSCSGGDVHAESRLSKTVRS